MAILKKGDTPHKCPYCGCISTIDKDTKFLPYRSNRIVCPQCGNYFNIDDNSSNELPIPTIVEGIFGDKVPDEYWVLSQNQIEDIDIFSSKRNSTLRTTDASVTIKNGNSEYKKTFNGTSIKEVIDKVFKFCNSLKP